MSVSYYSYAVIGIEIDEEMIKTKPEKKKAFPHNKPETMNYDPTTGKKLWEEKNIPELEFYDDLISKNWEGTEIKLKDFNLGIVHNTDNRRCFLGYVVNPDWYKDEDIGFSNSINVEKIKTTVKQLLEPYGLWDDKYFGLYAVQYCSY